MKKINKPVAPTKQAAPAKQVAPVKSVAPEIDAGKTISRPEFTRKLPSGKRITVAATKAKKPAPSI